MTVPTSLDEVINQAKTATQVALDAGINRIQIEILLPDLQVMPLAWSYLELFQDLGVHLKVFFADAGAAALARRDWQNPIFSVRGVNELLEPVQDSDQAFVCITPSPVEVSYIEQMCNAAGNRPFILLNPKLQDVAIVGIGYAGRQLRERFLNTLETAYYIRPLDDTTALLRAYPGDWEIWRDVNGEYQRLGATPAKPSGEQIDKVLYGEQAETPGGGGFFASMQRFLKALQQ
ncbi:DUF1995 family protein [Synechococcus sp. PCC 6312]|uniref:DUF1995 family protein n=1 Tax=Synechococcus sp. (strain ATCC 27167 / PCC 6312) TaxID=195253 RepID=UPI00029F01E4|nr:DUF1995 family protein [Synechococcus sp. PCC 6312]AFY61612.1 protein of unknown function (DUF1995) [Synechococcus sp. PCC 6312]